MIIVAGFEIDLAVTEEHTFDSEITAHPVEVGSDITDHVRLLPFQLNLDCVVSDTPIGPMIARRSATGSTIPSVDALAFLKALRKTREPFSVTTSLGTYANLVLRSLGIPRGADTGHALRFRVTFQEVELVTNARTTVKVSTPRGKKRISRGSKPAPVAGEGAPAQSLRTDDNASQMVQLYDGGNTFLASGVQ